MKRMIRLLALVISVFMLCGILSSCFLSGFLGGNKIDPKRTAELGEPDHYGKFEEGKYYATGDKIVDLEWLMSDDETYALNTKGKFFDDVEKITGVKIIPVPIVSRNLSNQINLQLASGKYSDIIMGTAGMAETLLNNASQGAFIPVDKLIPVYAPNINAKLSDTSFMEAKLWSTALDGRQYIIPQLRSEAGYNTHFTIRSDLLKEYNLKMPTTTDELMTVLQRFQAESQKKADAAGTKNKFVAFAATETADKAEERMNYFFFNFDVANNFFIENGVVKFGPADDRFKEGLMFLADLYKKHMIPADIFSLSEAQYFELYYGGNVGVGLNSLSRIRMSNEIFEGDKVPYRFELLKPLVTKSGARYANSEPVYKSPYVISYSCKDPIAALRLLDWFYTPEASLLSSYGIGLKDGIGLPVGSDSPMTELYTDPAEVKAKYPEWYKNEQKRIKSDLTKGIKTRAIGFDAATGELKGYFVNQILPSTAFEQRIAKEYGYFNAQKPCALLFPLHKMQEDPLLPTNGAEEAIAYLQSNIPIMPDLTKSSLGTADFRFYKLTIDESKELGSISGNLWTKCDEYFAKFVTGQIGFDKWDEYLSVLKGAKYERATEIMNIGYKRFISSVESSK